ncbi:hypothetical protein [Prosthecobacter sp.]|uniref:hypothetical protein n=1 Tax=Prosthecobacter sp. TaxID=1965333 RepID=UPI00378452E8
MNIYSTVTEVSPESFYEQLAACLKQHPSSPEALLFEELTEKEAHEKLIALGRPGWDFETTSLFFGERGTSILIQNIELDWQTVLNWICDLRRVMPLGSIINFEVYDSIQGSTMIGGKLLGRWLFTAEKAFMHR